MSQAYRIGGFGALLFSLCWVIQPIIVAVLAQAVYGTDQTVYDPTLLRSTAWFGMLNALAFAGMALGACLLALALDEILDLRRSIGGRAILFAGLAASAAWLMVAAGTATSHSGVVETARDFSTEARSAFILGMSAAVYQGVVAASLASGFWLIGLSVRGFEFLGRPLSVLAGLAGAASVLTSLYGPPWGVVLAVLFLIVLGISLLRRAGRTASRLVVASSSPA